MPTLLAAYSFDAQDGTDASGNGHTGTAVADPNGVTFIAHAGGYALGNDPATGSVTIPHMSIPNSTAMHPSVFTFMAWVEFPLQSGRMAVIGGSGLTSIYPDVCAGLTCSDLGGGQLAIRVQLITSQAGGGSHFNGTGATVNQSSRVPHHLAVAFDGVSTWTTFIDGVQIDTLTEAGAVSWSSSGWTIGTNSKYAGLGPSWIDDFRLYDAVLSTADVVTCMGVSVGAQADPLTAAPASGSAAGAVTWAGSVAGGAGRSGSAAGAASWTGSVTGRAGHSGGTSGAVSWTGAASGTAPAVAGHSGGVAGAITWTGSVGGGRGSSGAAGGGITWTGSVTGATSHTGGVTGAVAWAGAASGSTGHSGSTVGSVQWVGSVSGHAPPVGGHSGHVTGHVTWTGSAAGGTDHSGNTSGAITWTGTVTGGSSASGGITGTVTWTGAAAGGTDYSGSASGGIRWTGAVSGHSRAGRDIRITGTTVPVTGWATSGPRTGWATTTPTHDDWPTHGPAAAWATSAPEH